MESEYFAVFFGFTKLIFYLLIICHWGACFLYFIGSNECEAITKCWLSKKDLLERDLFTKYVASYYYFATTMFTVGYGELSPVTTNEKIFQIFVMLISNFIFAYIVGNIEKILSIYYDAQVIFREKTIHIQYFLDENQISSSLTGRIRSYLDFVFERKLEERIDGKVVLSMLNTNLGEEIQQEINGQLIFDFKYFKHDEYKNITLFLAKNLQLKNSFFSREESIFEVNYLLTFIKIFSWEILAKKFFLSKKAKSCYVIP